MRGGAGTFHQAQKTPLEKWKVGAGNGVSYAVETLGPVPKGEVRSGGLSVGVPTQWESKSREGADNMFSFPHCL